VKLRTATVMVMMAALFPLVSGGEEAAAIGPCFGKAPTIVIAAQGLVTNGTSGNDVILGTTGIDVIYGMGGDDRICAGLGGDEVHGGSGRDRIDGGDGNDWLFGDTGDDRILGGDGDDTLSGWGGRDVLIGDAGDDELWGGLHDDILRGRAGIDLIDGGPGRDWFDASSVTGSPGVAGLEINLTTGIYTGSVGGRGTILNIEHIAGTGKDDNIIGNPLKSNRLLGGDGDDRVVADSAGDVADGGIGNDRLVGEASSITLKGRAGDDQLTSLFSGIANGGPGTDRCRIGPGSTPVACERHRLICPGAGEPLSPSAVSLTTASADFDGNGTDGTLQVYRVGTTWYIRIETDSGYGAVHSLPTSGAEAARAIGGRDINKDGLDEAFLVTGSGAYTELVSIYTLFEPLGCAPDLRCDVEPVMFGGSTAEATFPVGASVGTQAGLICLPNGVREISQYTPDNGTTYHHDRITYSYAPGFGNWEPQLTWLSQGTLFLTRPGDDPVIDAAGTFVCGSLSL